MPTPPAALRRPSRYPPPARRRLRVFSLDPTLSRLEGASAVLSVPWEPLAPGPVGERIKVVDWDPGLHPCPKVDLDDPHLLAQDGLAPDERNRQFRQQMVYAVTTSLLETLDLARGRRLQWRNVWRTSDEPQPAVRPMPIYPQSEHHANAYYSPGDGLHFGAFAASEDDESGLFPGQAVYSCLSHDIINHETTHAFIHELRPLSLQPSGPDALAFHEGFADIIAILQHFRLPGLLETQLVRTGTALWEPGPFVELAGEFGRGAGRSGALRQALDDTTHPRRYDEFPEPHDRGAVLVAAFFDAFFAAYRYRIADLVRLAGLSGARLPGQSLPQDLVTRVANEARTAAAMVQTMAVRAFDYLPPANITFSDFLDAVITADTDLFPEDRDGFRRALVESCRRRGIYPNFIVAGDRSADEPRTDLDGLEPLPTRQALLLAAHDLRDPTVPAPRRRRTAATQLDTAWKTALLTWGREHHVRLGLDREALRVDGGNASFRWTQDGRPTTIVTARFTARDGNARNHMPPQLADSLLVGGATVIADGDGTIRHLNRKPAPRGDALDATVAFAASFAAAHDLDADQPHDDPTLLNALHAPPSRSTTTVATSNRR